MHEAQSTQAAEQPVQHSRRTLTSLAEEGCLDAGPEVAVRVSGPHRLQLVAAFFRLRKRTARTDGIHQELPLSMLSVFKQTGFKLPASQDWTPLRTKHHEHQERLHHKQNRKLPRQVLVFTLGRVLSRSCRNTGPSE